MKLNKIEDLIEIYSKSLQGIDDFIEKNKKRPNEKEWNIYAIEHNYLCSKWIRLYIWIWF